MRTSPPLFDRSDDYAALLDEIRQASDELDAGSGLETQKQARKLRKTFAGIAAIDFFAGEAQKQADVPCRSLNWRRPACWHPMNRMPSAVRSPH